MSDLFKNLPPIAVAFLRSLVGAFLLAGTYYFANDVELLSKTVLGIGFGYVALRAGVEGWYDQATKPDQNHPPASELDNLADPPAG